MADKKISALTAATTPLAGTEVLPIVQSGATVKVAVSDLTAGRAVSTSDLTYTGTLTGSTGVINIGSGQVYKDASGNVGLGTASPAYKLDISGGNARISSGAASTDLFMVDTGTTSGNVRLRSESNAFKFITGGGVSATLDSSGNLGLAVTPSAWGSSVKALEFSYGAFSGSSSIGTEVDGNCYYNGTNWIYRVGGKAYRYNQADAGHSWHVAATGTAGSAISFTQAMTLTAASQLLVGTTTVDSVGVTIAAADNNGCYSDSASTATRNHWRFANPNGVVGTIQTSGSATSYNTSSDYRLKENIEPMTGALATVAALKPCTYTWKADGSAGQGFIAHELQAVVPDCVTGEKDAVDAEGKPQYQGVDVSFLVATLTAAIQEQQAIITQLQADVAALKNA